MTNLQIAIQKISGRCSMHLQIWLQFQSCSSRKHGLVCSLACSGYKKYLGGARGVMVIIVGNGHGNMSSNPDETDCISHSTNTLGKSMNPIILPPAMGK